MSRLIITATIGVAMLFFAATSPAQQAAPQDNPGVDAYTETVPEPDGDKSTRNNGGGGITADDEDDAADEVLSDDAQQSLSSQGEAGAAAARLAESASPGSAPDGNIDKSDAAGGKDGYDGSSEDELKSEIAGSEGEDAEASLAAESSSSGPGGLGIGLPIALLASLAVAVGIRFFRGRSEA